MQLHLKLWPENENGSEQANLWGQQERNNRQMLINELARLMRKAATRNISEESELVNHDRYE